VPCRLLAKHAISAVVLPDDVLIAVKSVLDRRHFEFFRPSFAPFRLDADLELFHDVCVTVVRERDRLAWLDSRVVQHKSLLFSLAIDQVLLNEELLHSISRIRLINEHVLRSDGQHTPRILLEQILNDIEFAIHVLSGALDALSSTVRP